MSIKELVREVLYLFPKKWVVGLRYYNATKRKLDLNTPQDMNQKNLYLMLNEFGDKEQNCADKYLVRKYVKEKGLKDILTKLYGKYDKAEEIDFANLPNEYVIKTNHGCGNVYIHTKEKSFIKDKVIVTLNKALKRNYAKVAFEYQYSGIKPCILCEEYIKEPGCYSPTDYKIFCFNGKAKFILVCGDRDKKVKKTYYDLKWNKINCTIKPQVEDFKQPENFNQMIIIAEKLAEDFKFVRVDLYNVNGKIYFGELTFTPKGAINTSIKQEYLDKWGDMIVI